MPYGRIWDPSRRRTIGAHRAAYETWVGPIPEGLTLDHLCRNTLCINPAHLEPVSIRTNILRGTSPLAKAYASDVCKQGHPLSEENLRMRTLKGYPNRRCVTCFRAAQRKSVRRQRERMWARGLTSKGTPRIRQSVASTLYDSDANGIAGAESERAKFRAMCKGKLG
jgi:hypothetical protein